VAVLQLTLATSVVETAPRVLRPRIARVSKVGLRSMIPAMFAVGTEPLVQKYSAKTELLTALATAMAVIMWTTATFAVATVRHAA